MEEKRFMILGIVVFVILAMIPLINEKFSDSIENSTWYRYECVETSLDIYNGSCKFSMQTGGGFFGPPSRNIYNCDGDQVQEKCLRKDYVEFEGKVNLINMVFLEQEYNGGSQS